MNVAMLLSCGSFEGFFGGVQGQTRESYLKSYRGDWSWYYARGLLDNGIAPILYIPSLHESGRYETDAGIAVRFLPLDRWYRPIERVWIKRLSRATRWSLYAEERLNAIAFMKPLREGLAEDDVDLLYVQEYWSGRFDHIVPRAGVPVAGADHGGLPNRVVKWLKPRSIGGSLVCYGQTEEECRLIEKYGGRAKLQSNGCDTSEFFPDPTVRREQSVLTVTRLTNKQKRTSDLVCAMRRLPENWVLDIVGTGPDRGLLEKLVADLGLTSRVRFHGFVGRREIRDFLRRCGVYAMPSANEAVAIAALEAMGCGASVVLSRIRAFEQLVEDGVNGRLVPVGDVDGLASAILNAWEFREARGRAAADTMKMRYDTRMLYRQLADSLRCSMAMN